MPHYWKDKEKQQVLPVRRAVREALRDPSAFVRITPGRFKLPLAPMEPDMPDTTDHVVDVSNVAFAYGEREVLKDVTLVIPRGCIAGIMGASGSGKSTLLKLISGQLTPARGNVRVLGENVHEISRSELFRLRRRMGMQFQQGGLFTDLSVYENMAFQMRENTDLTENMINDLVLMKLEAVGLRGASHLMPGELSGGMARRVGLARAIAMDPALIMYDEPFAGLDPISCNVIAKLIRELNDALGATSIVVSYDAAESLKVIDHAFFLSDGVVAASGSNAEVKDSSDPFVRQFIRGEPDGPVPFHYTQPPYEADLDLKPRTAP